MKLRELLTVMGDANLSIHAPVTLADGRAVVGAEVVSGKLVLEIDDEDQAQTGLDEYLPKHLQPERRQ